MLARRNNEPEPANSRAKMELKTNTPITPAPPQEALAGQYIKSPHVAVCDRLDRVVYIAQNGSPCGGLPPRAAELNFATYADRIPAGK